MLYSITEYSWFNIDEENYYVLILWYCGWFNQYTLVYGCFEIFEGNGLGDRVIIMKLFVFTEWGL